jgi:DNA-binding NarL/FixJ family response regulator
VQPGSDSLSGRELQVLRSVAEGLSNKEIASDLDISVHTVARHVTNIMRKLSAANRAQAAATALRRGMLAF